MQYMDVQLAGMTVNERLSAFELFDEFDAAVATMRLAEVVAVLKKARFSEDEARFTASTLLSNLERYGYSAEGVWEKKRRHAE